MSDASPPSEVLLVLRQLVGSAERQAGQLDRLAVGQQQIETRLDGLETRLGGVKTQLGSMEIHLGSLETHLESLETHLGSLETSFGDVDARLTTAELGFADMRTEIAKLRADIMERLDRFQGSLDNVRDSTAVTLMMDQRVNKKLDETSRDRDDLFEQMMALERQMMLLALRVEAIEDRRH